MIVEKPLLIAGRDRSANGLARADLLLDPFEDHDVRVRRDADREDDPRDARERQRHVEEQDRAVEKDAVDAEPDNRDDAEEAVEDEQEDGDRDEAADAGDERLSQRVLTQRRRDLRALNLDELDRQRAGLEDERQVLRLGDRVEPGDLRVAAGDPVHEVGIGEVDDRVRTDLVVEDDREALGERAGLLAIGDSGQRRLLRAALGELAGDVVELVPALVRELEEDNRLAVLAEVLTRPTGVQVLAGELRHRVLLVVRPVLEEVVPGAVRRDAARARRDRLVRVLGGDGSPAGEDDPVVRHDVVRRSLRRRAAVELVEERLLGRRGPGEPLLRLGVEVPLARRRPLGDLVLGGQQRQESLARDGVAVGVLGHLRDVLLEVVERELGRLPDDLRGPGGVEDACEGDRDLVRPLLADLRLGDADLVDAVADDLHRPVHVLLRQLLALRRARLEDDLEAALEVEPEGRAPEEPQRDDGEDGADQREKDEDVSAHCGGAT